jgi:hypothetical protein
VALFGPFLAFVLSVVLQQAAEQAPSLEHAARVFFLVASACMALGFGAVLGSCSFHLVKSMWRGSRTPRQEASS